MILFRSDITCPETKFELNQPNSEKMKISMHFTYHNNCVLGLHCT